MSDPSTALERRTQEMGRALYQRVQSYTPRVDERLQDRLMLVLMQDATLRMRLLRFVDVLAALRNDPGGRRTAAIFREYFQGGFSEVPFPLRLAIGAGRSAALPDTIVAGLAREGMMLIANRFVVKGGQESIHGALDDLSRHGRFPSFDLLGEAVVSEGEAEAYKQGYLRLLEDLGRHPLARQRTKAGGPCLEVSLKLTGLTSQFYPSDPEGTLHRVRPALEEICGTARERGIGVTVDAEQFAFRDSAWNIVREVFGKREALGGWEDMGIVVQAYLRDAEDQARDILAFARDRETPFRIRLVKGAYWDQEVIVAQQNGWPVPVFQDKALTDQSFDALVRVFLTGDAPVRLAVGSHNVRSHAHAEAVRESLGLPPETLEHQTLYRTMEALSRALPQMGWVTRDYVPAGDLVAGMAYLVRRILENTSQAGFLSKARLEDNPDDLLEPPKPGRSDASYLRPAYPTGFVNTPTTRLFDSWERARFVAALEAAWQEWGRDYPLRIGGETIRTARRRAVLSPSHPAPAHPVGIVHEAGPDETSRAIAVANVAAPLWAAVPVNDRVEIGLRAAALLRDRKNDVAAWVVHEGGRTWSEALADVEEAVDHIEWNARELARLGDLLNAKYRPRGVVACIPPWNFPSALVAGMTSAALFAGNAVILKSAEETPIVARLLVDTFYEAGVPLAALVHLPGPGETVGDALVQSPEVDMVAFTGSKAVGAKIYEKVAQVAPQRGGIKRALTEMGGKNAVVVFPDADLDEAVQGIIGSAFSHAGQKCSAAARAIIHRDIYARLSDRLVEAARSLPVGPADAPDTVVNPVINRKARDRILSYGKVAWQEGRVLLDLMDVPGAEGWSVGPMIVEVSPETAHTARIAQEEVFGPLLVLIPFDTEDQAVSLVNDVKYGLTMGIFSRSPSTVQRMARACEAGNIYVNRGITGARVGIEPFGGHKLSGTGPKAGGTEYLLAFLTRKDGYRRNSDERQDGIAGQEFPVHLRAWDAAPDDRLRTLHDCLTSFAANRAALSWAVTAWVGPARDPVAEAAQDVLLPALATLDHATEVTQQHPTVAIPGQDTFTIWAPRGVGMVAVDETSNPAALAGLLLGALVAGNGVIVAVEEKAREVAQVLVEGLWAAGVPRDVLTLASEKESWAGIAGQKIQFAAVDLPLEATRVLDRVLSMTDEEGGQRWLKALVSLSEGPCPGEAGFLRRLALPKTVAVQTLRHGANLELV